MKDRHSFQKGLPILFFRFAAALKAPSFSEKKTYLRAALSKLRLYLQKLEKRWLFVYNS